MSMILVGLRIIALLPNTRLPMGVCKDNSVLGASMFCFRIRQLLVSLQLWSLCCLLLFMLPETCLFVAPYTKRLLSDCTRQNSWAKGSCLCYCTCYLIHKYRTTFSGLSRSLVSDSHLNEKEVWRQEETWGWMTERNGCLHFKLHEKQGENIAEFLKRGESLLLLKAMGGKFQWWQQLFLMGRNLFFSPPLTSSCLLPSKAVFFNLSNL